MKDLETPTIVKSLGYENEFNVNNRVAQQMSQTITNRQAFDLVYPTHRDYYNDKRFVVFDDNFNKVEDYLLNQFKSAIDTAFDYNANKNLVHVEDFNKNTVNPKAINFGNAPLINRDAVKTNIKYSDYSPVNSNTKVSSSDPYGTIFGGDK